MTQATVPVVVDILGKEYRIACTENEREALLASARYLDEKMGDVKTGGKVVGSERIAVMAALNIAHELLQEKFHKHEHEHERNKQLQSRITGMKGRIEIALDGSPQLPI